MLDPLGLTNAITISTGKADILKYIHVHACDLPAFLAAENHLPDPESVITRTYKSNHS